MEDYEKVNHPDHYQSDKIEAIDLISSFNLNFAMGNALKYILRAGKKPESSKNEDIQKAIWYLQYEIGERNFLIHRRNITLEISEKEEINELFPPEIGSD